jgi:hypothetical protein
MPEPGLNQEFKPIGHRYTEMDERGEAMVRS